MSACDCMCNSASAAAAQVCIVRSVSSYVRPAGRHCHARQRVPVCPSHTAMQYYRYVRVRADDQRLIYQSCDDRLALLGDHCSGLDSAAEWRSIMLHNSLPVLTCSKSHESVIGASRGPWIPSCPHYRSLKTTIWTPNIFATRRVCIAWTMPWKDVCPSVCLSVRLSHAGIESKRLYVSSQFLHRRVVPPF